VLKKSLYFKFKCLEIENQTKKEGQVVFVLWELAETLEISFCSLILISKRKKVTGSLFKIVFSKRKIRLSKRLFFVVFKIFTKTEIFHLPMVKFGAHAPGVFKFN
jgi:hypothetical protein